MAFPAEQKLEKTRRFPHQLIVFGPLLPQLQGHSCLGLLLATLNCGHGRGTLGTLGEFQEHL